MIRSLLVAAALIFSELPTRQAAGIEQLSWMQGCWQLTRGARVVEEQWTVPRAHTMLGMGRTTRGDSIVEYEMELIREQGGVFSYEAHPSGQPSAVFTAHGASDSVVFENPQHDYPQQVGYRRISPESLLAWTDGAIGGRQRRIEFPYARVRCGGS